jgi:hypothetical protein
MLVRRALAALALVLALGPALALAQPTPGQPQAAAMIHVYDGRFIDSTENGTVVPPGAVVAVMSFVNSADYAPAPNKAQPHTLTADDGSFNLDIPAPDNPNGYVYLQLTAPSKVGRYPYHSALAGDGDMHGVLVVQGIPGQGASTRASPALGVPLVAAGLAAAALLAGGRRRG